MINSNIQIKSKVVLIAIVVILGLIITAMFFNTTINTEENFESEGISTIRDNRWVKGAAIYSPVYQGPGQAAALQPANPLNQSPGLNEFNTITQGQGLINPGMTGQVGPLPSPARQNAAQKVLVEGHWLGMELIPLTPELAKEYNIPQEIDGLLVDEVCLEAAESGLLAGDMVVSINNYLTPNIREFTEATRRVKDSKKANMNVLRRGRYVDLTIGSRRSLGFSQNESAQPIRPGQLSPHRNRSRPCTDCHVIMQSGGQLPTDAVDISPMPMGVPIQKGAKAPHRYRGQCNYCHVIK